MYIYNSKQNFHTTQHILDPDYLYHTSHKEEYLIPFFKQLHIPQHIQTMVSVYIEFEIQPYIFEKSPYIYQKFSTSIQTKIEKYLDFGHANLYCEESNMFYLVMFDVSEETIYLSFERLHQFLTQKTFLFHNHSCSFEIKGGIYFSNIYIHPIEFYKCAKDQFYNTLDHKQSILSIKNL